MGVGVFELKWCFLRKTRFHMCAYAFKGHACPVRCDSTYEICQSASLPIYDAPSYRCIYVRCFIASCWFFALVFLSAPAASIVDMTEILYTFDHVQSSCVLPAACLCARDCENWRC